MIKKFKLYILLAAVVLSTTSCLDKMPEDSIPFDEAIQTVDDVNLAVIGIYDAFKSSSLYSGSLTMQHKHLQYWYWIKTSSLPAKMLCTTLLHSLMNILYTHCVHV